MFRTALAALALAALACYVVAEQPHVMQQLNARSRYHQMDGRVFDFAYYLDAENGLARVDLPLGVVLQRGDWVYSIAQVGGEAANCKVVRSYGDPSYVPLLGAFGCVRGRWTGDVC